MGHPITADPDVGVVSRVTEPPTPVIGVMEVSETAFILTPNLSERKLAMAGELRK